MDVVEREFHNIRAVVVQVFPQLVDVKIRKCEEDEREHEMNKRHYATAHLDKMLITYAESMNDLPLSSIRGILWHEFGHFIDELLSKHRYEPPEKEVEKFLKDLEHVPHEDKYSEAKANYYIWRFFKIKIKYGLDTVQKIL